MSFAGKVVLVTGSTSGIGEACARLFAESGAAVMVSGRNDRSAAARSSPSISAAGGTAQFAAADLRAAGACERLDRRDRRAPRRTRRARQQCRHSVHGQCARYQR